MKNAGLKVPLVIFDREAIKENMKNNQPEKNDDEKEK